MKKLRLHRETLRSLRPAQTGQVAGGRISGRPYCDPSMWLDGCQTQVFACETQAEAGCGGYTDDCYTFSGCTCVPTCRMEICWR